MGALKTIFRIVGHALFAGSDPLAMLHLMAISLSAKSFLESLDHLFKRIKSNVDH